MTPTNVELYEALKPTVGEEAARMIAEIFPAAANLATKADIQATKADIQATKADLQLEVAGLRAETAELRVEMRGGFADVRGELREGLAQVRGEMREGFAQARADGNADRVSMLKWLIALMVPMWLGSWGAIAAVVLKS